jgi:hypothetical protein
MHNFTKEEFCIVVSRYSEDVNWTKPFGENCIIYNKGKSDLDYIDKERIILLDNVGKEGATYIKHIIDNYENLSDHIAFLQGYPFHHMDFYSSEDERVEKLYNVLNEIKLYDFKIISTWMVKVNEEDISKYGSGLPNVSISLGAPIKIKVLIVYLNYFIETNLFDIDMEKLKVILLDLIKSKDTIELYEFSNIITKMPYFMCNENGNKIRDELFSKFDFSYILPWIKSGYYYGSGALFVVSKKLILKHPKSFWTDLFKSLQEKNPAAGYGLEKLWPFIFLKN